MGATNKQIPQIPPGSKYFHQDAHVWFVWPNGNYALIGNSQHPMRPIIAAVAAAEWDKICRLNELQINEHYESILARNAWLRWGGWIEEETPCPTNP